AELVLFNAIKTTLLDFITLYHFNPKRLLYFDFDVSKYSISVEIYYIKENILKKI
ncbi:hypothetical protein V8F20_012723, partial [Naviculisporaceae sp. PSN 640]